MLKVGRPKQSGDTHGRCVQAAEYLFAEKGFDGTSLREVGKNAGITSAAVLHHFQSKERLYSQVLQRLASRMTEYMGACEGGSDLNCIILFFDRFLDFCFENKHYAQLLLRELMENEGRVYKARRMHLANPVQTIVAPIKRGQADGQFLECDAELFVFYILGAITHFAAAAPTIERMLGDPVGTPLERFRKVLRDQVSMQLTGCASTIRRLSEAS